MVTKSKNILKICTLGLFLINPFSAQKETNNNKKITKNNVQGKDKLKRKDFKAKSKLKKQDLETKNMLKKKKEIEKLLKKNIAFREEKIKKNNKKIEKLNIILKNKKLSKKNIKEEEKTKIEKEITVLSDSIQKLQDEISLINSEGLKGLKKIEDFKKQEKKKFAVEKKQNSRDDISEKSLNKDFCDLNTAEKKDEEKDEGNKYDFISKSGVLAIKDSEASVSTEVNNSGFLKFPVVSVSPALDLKSTFIFNFNKNNKKSIFRKVKVNTEVSVKKDIEVINRFNIEPMKAPVPGSPSCSEKVFKFLEDIVSIKNVFVEYNFLRVGKYKIGFSGGYRVSPYTNLKEDSRFFLNFLELKKKKNKRHLSIGLEYSNKSAYLNKNAEWSFSSNPFPDFIASFGEKYKHFEFDLNGILGLFYKNEYNVNKGNVGFIFKSKIKNLKFCDSFKVDLYGGTSSFFSKFPIYEDIEKWENLNGIDVFGLLCKYKQNLLNSNLLKLFGIKKIQFFFSLNIEFLNFKYPDYYFFILNKYKNSLYASFSCRLLKVQMNKKRFPVLGCFSFGFCKITLGWGKKFSGLTWVNKYRAQVYPFVDDFWRNSFFEKVSVNFLDVKYSCLYDSFCVKVSLLNFVWKGCSGKERNKMLNYKAGDASLLEFFNDLTLKDGFMDDHLKFIPVPVIWEPSISFSFNLAKFLIEKNKKK